VQTPWLSVKNCKKSGNYYRGASQHNSSIHSGEISEIFFHWITVIERWSYPGFTNQFAASRISNLILSSGLLGTFQLYLECKTLIWLASSMIKMILLPIKLWKFVPKRKMKLHIYGNSKIDQKLHALFAELPPLGRPPPSINFRGQGCNQFFNNFHHDGKYLNFYLSAKR